MAKLLCLTVVCCALLVSAVVAEESKPDVNVPRATNWEKRNLFAIQQQAAADQSHGSPTDGPQLDVCTGLGVSSHSDIWLGASKVRIPITQHMECMTLEIRQLRNLKDPPAQQGGPLPLDTPLSVVCRAARSPGTPEAGRASACMTEFQPMTCGSTVPYAGKNMFYPEIISFSGPSMCQSGYQVNSVQCEVRYFVSQERKGSLGVFRVTPADMSLAGTGEFISVPLFRHRIAPWPTFQWLYGSPAGSVIVRLGCGSKDDTLCWQQFRALATPYRARNVVENESRYKKSLLNWQRERPFPVRFGTMSPLVDTSSAAQATFLNRRTRTGLSMEPLNADVVAAKRWNPGDGARPGETGESGAVTSDGATATTSATDDDGADDDATDDAPSGREILMQLTREENQQKSGAYRKAHLGASSTHSDSQAELSDDTDVLTSSRARWGKDDRESGIVKLAKEQEDKRKKYDLGNVPPEETLPLYDRLQKANSWADHMRVTNEQAKIMGKFTWTDHGGCPLIFSHRAVVSSDDVENTLDAALKSATAGVDGLEIDVFMTGSYEYGGYVATMLHDVNLDRLIGYAQSVANWNYFTLQRMNQIKARLAQCDLFPTLSDLLKLCHALDLKLNIELKPGEPDFVVKTFPDYAAKLGHEVGRLIREHRVSKQVVVSSFDPAKLRYVNEDFPTGDPVRTVAATYKTFQSKTLTRFGKWFGKMQVHGECLHYSLATESLVKKYHAKFQPVGVYTIYDLAEPKTGDSFKDETIKSLIDMKVDWIETDDPRRLQKTLVRLGCKSTRPYDQLAKTRRDIINQARRWRSESLTTMLEAGFDAATDPNYALSKAIPEHPIAVHLAVGQYSVSPKKVKKAPIRTNKVDNVHPTAYALLHAKMLGNHNPLKLDVTQLTPDGFHILADNWRPAPNKVPMKTLQLTPESMTMIPLSFRFLKNGDQYRFFVGNGANYDTNALLNPELHIPLSPLYNDRFAELTNKGRASISLWIRPHCPESNRAAMGLFNFRPTVVTDDWRRVIMSHNRGGDGEATIKLPLRQNDITRAMVLAVENGKHTIPSARQICLVVHSTNYVNVVGRVSLARRQGPNAGDGIALTSKVSGKPWLSTVDSNRNKTPGKPDAGVTVEDAIIGTQAVACEGETKQDCVCTSVERCKNTRRTPMQSPDLCPSTNIACTKPTKACNKANGVCTTLKECGRRARGVAGFSGFKATAAYLPGLCSGTKNIVCCSLNPPEELKSKIVRESVFFGYNRAPSTSYLNKVHDANAISSIMRAEDYQICDDAGNCL